MAQESESRELDKIIVRLPDGMRDRLKAAAAENNRSVNAEVVHRLQTTLEMDDYVPQENIHTDDRQVVLSKEEVEALLYEAAAKALASFKKKP